MLKCRIALEDVGQPWAWSGDRWAAGGSWIEPYQHPMLTHYQATGSRFTIRDHSGRDFTAVECRPGQVTFSTGAWGTAPLYLTSRAGVLHGSWDYMDLRGHLDPLALNDAAVARLLTYWRRYDRDTLWRDVVMLTERASAAFTGAGLAMTYPAPAAHSRARELRANADPVAVLDVLLATELARHGIDPDLTAVELSGGMDSAMVATSLPDAVTACAMMIGGPEGDQQARRRRHMLNRFGISRDVQVPGMAYSPLLPSGDRASGVPVHPDEEPFAEATAALLHRLAERGIRFAVTGIGGDEMLALREWERDAPLDQDHMQFPPWVTREATDALLAAESNLAPASPISEVTLMGFACRWPLYLRAGVWPVSPLASPALIRFGEWLPMEWRRGKRLFRERLSRCGLPDEVVHPPLQENLSRMMGHGLRECGIPALRKMLDDGLLLDDLGYVDPDQVWKACAATEHQTEPEIDRRLFPVIALETALRGVHRRAPQSTDTLTIMSQRHRRTRGI